MLRGSVFPLHIRAPGLFWSFTAFVAGRGFWLFIVFNLARSCYVSLYVCYISVMGLCRCRCRIVMGLLLVPFGFLFIVYRLCVSCLVGYMIVIRLLCGVIGCGWLFVLVVSFCFLIVG